MVRVCSLVLVLILASSSAALAQNKGAGFRIGVNFSSPAVDPDPGDDFPLEGRTGIVGGVFYVFPVAPHFSIQPEWLYSQKRAEVTFPGEGTTKFDLDYFDVPILLRWDSTQAAASSFNVFAGPSFNWRHRARAEGPEGDEDIREDIERIDLGLVLGAGIEAGRFVLDGRYQFGLKDINKESDEEGFTIKHRVFSVSAGVRF
jgi:hypothetical protein